MSRSVEPSASRSPSPAAPRSRALEDAFPYRGFPTGWFQVAWSDEVAAGDVKPLRYFALDLVLYRGHDGTPVLLDAHCPHMGAHLGHGGRVEGCDIVCPFHGWQWAPDGRNTMVPSDGAATDRRRMRTWSLHETNGIVWAWYDALGRPPLWEPLEEHRSDRDFLPVYPHCVHRWERMHARPQYMVENVVDRDHFPWVHGNRSNPEITATRDLGRVYEVDMTTVYGVGKQSTWATPDGPVATVITHRLYGIGTIFADWGPGSDGSLLISNQTPVDHDCMDMNMTVLVCQDPASTSADVPEGRALKRVEEQRKQTNRDKPIWEHLAYVDRPPYARSEGRIITEFRRWARQFYPLDDPAQADAVAGVA